ncbi:MAG: hypothetical protein A2086_14835 [Spirochaetes bacterium GWD1_27_9]|nr:MAG: hypothetical protein A2Z98_11545 [Spirochaetes bacterium GWB1_27_13]OHD21006.1 MAG: hypothetical protein A2Y34_12030 [Spirochaetes bacterium GWC1_27_15]OHD45368.1 MAG: hypothetical protein A2086_14835 [Spirochaetes bacterium GWD1_27_9]
MIFLAKFRLVILFLFFTNSFFFCGILLEEDVKLSIPSHKFFKQNSEFIKPLKYKQITVAEYLTDPLILYANLWGCFGLTSPLWEGDSLKIIDTSNEKTLEAKSSKFSSIFFDRMKLEPFVSGRNYNIVKNLTDSSGKEVKDSYGNVIQVLKNDFYAKNIIEPIFFVWFGLYLRAKNYHPALMIVEIFALSFLYEFTVRPFFMNASFEQLLKNPAIGIVCGILLDEVSTFLLTTPYIGLHVLAYILNPFNALPTARIHPLLFLEPFKQTANLEVIIKL